MRHLSDGTLDPAFAWHTDSFGSHGEYAYDVALDDQNRIFVTGSGNAATLTSGSDFTFVRRLADGSRDPSFFGTGSVQLATAVNMGELGNTMNRQADGKYVVAGKRLGFVGNLDGVVLRMSDGGQLDPTFSDDGWLVLPDVAEEDVADSALAPGPSVIVVGTMHAENDDGFIVRITL